MEEEDGYEESDHAPEHEASSTVVVLAAAAAVAFGMQQDSVLPVAADVAPPTFQPVVQVPGHEGHRGQAQQGEKGLGTDQTGKNLPSVE